MDEISTKKIKEILESYSFYPKKSLGQNFITEKDILEKITKAALPSKEDIVIEIGAGIGTLTSFLAKYTKHVYAIEKDRHLIPILENTLKEKTNITILNEDVLKFKIPVKKYKVVGNLPYYITSAIFRKFLEEENPPVLMVFTVQKEVAQRIVAHPPRMNLLAASVQFYATPEIIKNIPRNYFWPVPQVTSSVLRITPFPSPENSSVGFRKKFFKILSSGFSQPRKQLVNNLSRELQKEKKEIRGALEKSGVSPRQRAENLSIENWTKVAKNLRI